MLVDEVLFELLLPDLLQLHLSLDLPLNTLLFGFFAFCARLLFMVVGFQKRLIFLLLAIDTINGLLVLSLLLCVLLGRRIGQFCKAYLCFGHVLSQNVVNIAVLLFLLRLNLLLPARLEDLLKLCLLLLAQLVSILEQLYKLFFGQFDVRAAFLAILFVLSVLLLIALLLILIALLDDPNRLSVLVNSVHLITILLHLLLHLLLMDQELLLLLRCQLLQELLLLLWIKAF